MILGICIYNQIVLSKSLQYLEIVSNYHIFRHQKIVIEILTLSFFQFLLLFNYLSVLYLPELEGKKQQELIVLLW